jgi:hypothetical protein
VIVVRHLYAGAFVRTRCLYVMNDAVRRVLAWGPTLGLPRQPEWTDIEAYQQAQRWQAVDPIPVLVRELRLTPLDRHLAAEAMNEELDVLGKAL